MAQRCSASTASLPSASTASSVYAPCRYMRDEWGHEKRGDRALFEKLCLEGAQVNSQTRSLRWSLGLLSSLWPRIELQRGSMMTSGLETHVLLRPQ